MYRIGNDVSSVQSVEHLWRRQTDSPVGRVRSSGLRTGGSVRAGGQDQVLGLSLGDQEAVERIVVDRGKVADAVDVVERDRTGSREGT